MDNEQIRDIEVHLLLEAIRMRFGYDFHGYSRDSLRRRILGCLAACDFRHVSEIVPRLLYEEGFFDRLILEMTVTVTEMFRDPQVYHALLQHVFPLLRTHPFINVWHAGCASGEEVYSLAILLKEENLYDRARIYATDINEDALAKAREGVYPVARLKNYEENYSKAGGRGSLADHCLIRYDLARMDPGLRENMVFANHNLVTDEVFTETHLILCRNVLIYFAPVLQNRVLHLFADGLVHGGFLCLGSKETLRFSDVVHLFSPVSREEKIYRKHSGLEKQP